MTEDKHIIWSNYYLDYENCRDDLEADTMSETYIDLPTRLEEDFPEIDSDITMELMDGNGEIHLTTEERATFVQYLHLRRQRDDMERHRI